MTEQTRHKNGRKTRANLSLLAAVPITPAVWGTKGGYLQGGKSTDCVFDRPTLLAFFTVTQPYTRQHAVVTGDTQRRGQRYFGSEDVMLLCLSKTTLRLCPFRSVNNK